MATRYGTAGEVIKTTRELESARALEADPYRFGMIEDKNEFRKRKASLEAQVKRITPPPITTDAERSVLEHRSKVLENFIRGPARFKGSELPAMQSKVERWEKPAGAVGRFNRHQNKMKNLTVDLAGNVVRAEGGYGAVSEWKDIQRRLTPLDEQLVDPDVCNVDRLQPAKAGIGLADRRRMSFAPGAYVSEEQWNETFGEPEAEPPTASAASQPKPVPEAAPIKPKKEKRVMTEADQCIEIRNDGTRCTGWKMHGKEHCFGHSRRHKAAQE